MKPSRVFVFTGSALSCAVWTAFIVHHTPLWMYLLLTATACMLIVIPVSIGCVFIHWRAMRWRSALPLAACVVAISFVKFVAPAIRPKVQERELKNYEPLALRFEAGEFPVTAELERVPRAEAVTPSAYAIFAQKDAEGILQIEFLTERGFPVYHGGYLYTSSGKIEPHSMMDSRWPFRRLLKVKWFFVSD